jgi:hypothetical protein
MQIRYFTPCIVFLLILMAGCGKDDADPASIEVKPNDFLSGSKYDKLVVEVQFVEGFAPTNDAIVNLQSFLEQRLNKPGGITVMQHSVPSPGKTNYSLTDLQRIEKDNRTHSTTGKTITSWLFFADGDYASSSGNSKVLGIAYGNSSMVIFQKTIKEFSGGIGEPPARTLESTVILHEFGHILGLVNNGTSVQTSHQDTAHGHHCNDQNCLMYYTAETSDIVGNIVGGNIPTLTSSCIEDLKGNGGK